ncbi:MAG: MATE family efflux transporter [Clostridia bacterium]|nr:MATE family efflux transporter [Clostridia bacterium]
MRQSHTTSLIEGNPAKTILLFAVPMILSNLFQQLYNVIDTLIVSNTLGIDALAALGSAGSITAIFVQLATGLSLGGSVVIAQLFGAGQRQQVRKCAATITIFCGVLALFSTVFMLIFARPILTWVNTPPESLDMAVTYIRWYFVGCIPIFIYNALNGVYVALDNSRTPLIFLIISSVTNVVLDILFVVVIPWGVAGAAAATAISQIVVMTLALHDAPKLLFEFPLIEKEEYFDKKLLGKMLKIALPSALQQSVVSIGTVVVQATINSFGAAVAAGSTAANRIFNLVVTVPINYSNAYSNYVGQNIGAGKWERIWPGMRASLIVCCTIVAVMSSFMILIPEQIIGLFISTTELDVELATNVGVTYISTIGWFMPICAAYLVIRGALKGSGDMGWFVFVTLFCFAIRLVATVGFAHVVGTSVIWWSICAGWTLSLFIVIARYLQGGWKKKALIK